MDTEYRNADPRQSCHRKSAFGTERVARLVAQGINAHYPEPVTRAYGCSHCGRWHIGRAPGVTGEPVRRSRGPRPQSWRHKGRGME